MAASDQLPESIRDALAKDVINRLPLTFLPFVNQQLHQWDTLFPNERKSVERLILYVASLNAEQSARCFREVTDLESKMGVRQWKSFSTTEQTIENASLLARSRWYRDWRRAVQAVFDAADGYAKTSGADTPPGNRLVLLDLPRPLELDPAKVWRRWQQIGKPVTLDLPDTGPAGGILETLLVGSPGASGANSPGLLSAIAARTQTTAAETWIVDAGRSFVDAVMQAQPQASANTQPILLSFTRLETYRQKFSHEMNTMHKDLTDADAVYDRLRNVDVLPWCPPEIASDPARREFVRNLYLSGNGAVIFGNSFVEWASSEALRRARPQILAAKFGMRSKPKPFTGVAVFENPDQVNPLPSVDDVPGSSIDAQMLALYIWLAAARYDEYQRSTACVCIAESIAQAYIVAPPEFPLMAGPQPIAVSDLSRALRTWIE
jgi:hypothetical protein